MGGVIRVAGKGVTRSPRGEGMRGKGRLMLKEVGVYSKGRAMVWIERKRDI